jgi:hypothetical protein
LKYQLLNKFLCYYQDTKYQLTQDGLYPCDLAAKAKIIILARQHYIERHVTFPIALRKDVRAAAEFEAEQLQPQFYVFYKLSPVQSGKTSVTFWQVPKQIVPAGTLMVLPETFLLSQLIADKELLSYRAAPQAAPVYLIKTKQGIRSSASVKQNKNVFCHAIGQTIEKERELLPADFCQHLVNALKLALPNLLTGFWLKNSNQQRSMIEKATPFALPLAVLGGFYLLLSSAYLQYQLSNAEQAVASHKDEIAQVLASQKQLNALQVEIGNYQTIGANRQPLWQIWQILAPLYQQGVEFRFIRFNGDKVLFSAQAASASEILAYMHKDPLSSHAEFTTAVRKQGDHESFIISFSLVAQVEAQHEG